MMPQLITTARVLVAVISIYGILRPEIHAAVRKYRKKHAHIKRDYVSADQRLRIVE